MYKEENLGGRPLKYKTKEEREFCLRLAVKDMEIISL